MVSYEDHYQTADNDAHGQLERDIESAGDRGDAKVLDALSALEEEVGGLRDLFARRLLEDRQKNELIKALDAAARWSAVEPFLHDLILLVDRLDRGEQTEFVASVREELLDILGRRGVRKIEVGATFDPRCNKAVRVESGEPGSGTVVRGVIRDGYMADGRVIRPAEVVVARG